MKFGLVLLFTLLLIALKLDGIFTFGWIWVFAPLWIPAALIILIWVPVLIAMLAWWREQR